MNKTIQVYKEFSRYDAGFQHINKIAATVFIH